MGRRTIYKAKELYKQRADYWSMHYQSRAYASSSGIDSMRVLNALVSVGMPEPEMQIDGSLYEPLDVLRAQRAVLDRLGYSFVSIEFQHRMCAWYWSEANWMDFVRQFQALPDLTEDYYLLYDAERDGGRLVPMSSKLKRGDSPVGSPVGKPVDKSGTSQVQVPSHRYKSPVLGGRSGVGE